MRPGQLRVAAAPTVIIRSLVPRNVVIKSHLHKTNADKNNDRAVCAAQR